MWKHFWLIMEGDVGRKANDYGLRHRWALSWALEGRSKSSLSWGGGSIKIFLGVDPSIDPPVHIYGLRGKPNYDYDYLEGGRTGAGAVVRKWRRQLWTTLNLKVAAKKSAKEANSHYKNSLWHGTTLNRTHKHILSLLRTTHRKPVRDDDDDYTQEFLTLQTTPPGYALKEYSQLP